MLLTSPCTPGGSTGARQVRDSYHTHTNKKSERDDKVAFPVYTFLYFFSILRERRFFSKLVSLPVPLTLVSLRSQR